jgi:hypothetical protein
MATKVGNEEVNFEFIINEYGVCINPERITLIQESHSFVAIELAELDGKWTYSTRIIFHDKGDSSLPRFGKDEKIYRNRELAKQAALQNLNEKKFEFIISTYGNRAELFAEKLKQIIEKNFQLELFT